MLHCNISAWWPAEARTPAEGPAESRRALDRRARAGWFVRGGLVLANRGRGWLALPP